MMNHIPVRCGDFVQNPVCMMGSRFNGAYTLNKKLCGNAPENRRKFFWTYYVPLMRQILEKSVNHQANNSK